MKFEYWVDFLQYNESQELFEWKRDSGWFSEEWKALEYYGDMRWELIQVVGNKHIFKRIRKEQ